MIKKQFLKCFVVLISFLFSRGAVFAVFPDYEEQQEVVEKCKPPESVQTFLDKLFEDDRTREIFCMAGRQLPRAYEPRAVIDIRNKIKAHAMQALDSDDPEVRKQAAQLTELEDPNYFTLDEQKFSFDPSSRQQMFFSEEERADFIEFIKSTAHLCSKWGMKDISKKNFAWHTPRLPGHIIRVHKYWWYPAERTQFDCRLLNQNISRAYYALRINKYIEDSCFQFVQPVEHYLYSPYVGPNTLYDDYFIVISEFKKSCYATKEEALLHFSEIIRDAKQGKEYAFGLIYEMAKVIWHGWLFSFNVNDIIWVAPDKIAIVDIEQPGLGSIVHDDFFGVNLVQYEGNADAGMDGLVSMLLGSNQAQKDSIRKQLLKLVSKERPAYHKDDLDELVDILKAVEL
jgi:hypothetical protein